MLDENVSPWYNCHGWLGVKKQLLQVQHIWLLSFCGHLGESYWFSVNVCTCKTLTAERFWCGSHPWSAACWWTSVSREPPAQSFVPHIAPSGSWRGDSFLEMLWSWGHSLVVRSLTVWTYFLGLQGIMGFDSWHCLPPCCGRPLIADLYHFKMLNTLLECPITTELFLKNGYGFNACNNEIDILYNTDIISSINWLFTVLWVS